MKAWPHQIVGADKGYKILKKYGILYLSWEERTGKSLTALLIAEIALVIEVLIVTKKDKPLKDWEDLIRNYPLCKIYHVVSYHQVCKMNKRDWDLIILDESHNYVSGYPKTSKIWNDIRRITRGKPIIYMSATPYAQTPALLFHQLALSDWSPFYRYKNYRAWHVEYGIPYTKWIYQKEVSMFNKVKDNLVIAETKHLFTTYTRKELNFKWEPEDNLHYIDLNPITIGTYNSILKHKVFERKNVTIEYDTKTKLRYGLHMLEGGILKHTTFELNTKGKPKKVSSYFDMGNTEKIDFIKQTWGDKEDVAIMYHFIGEGKKLRNHFEHAEILQATTHAEGISLMHIEHLIIYSQDYSTAKHTQRRARQTNMERDTPINVHFLLVNKGISEEVYDTVSRNKMNYVDEMFKGTRLSTKS